MLDRTRVTFWEEAVQLFDNISDEYSSCKMKKTVDFEIGATMKSSENFLAGDMPAVNNLGAGRLHLGNSVEG